MGPLCIEGLWSSEMNVYCMIRTNPKILQCLGVTFKYPALVYESNRPVLS